MSGLVDVDPRTNNEAKLALASLLGSTMAQLKEIDKSIIGSSSNIQSKLDVNNILGVIKSRPAPQPQVHYSQSPQPEQPAITYAPVSVPAHSEPVHTPTNSEPQEDPNQLVFDFNKPITPETINNKLDAIVSKLDRIIELLNT